MEHKIIAAIIADRQSFEQIEPHLGSEDVSPEGAQVLRAVRDFYLKDPDAQRADFDLITGAVMRRLSNPKHRELLDLYLQRVERQDISAVNIVDAVLSAKRESLELSLAEAIAAKQHTRVDELVERLSQLRMDAGLEGSVHEEYQGLTPQELVEIVDPSNRISLAPESLNRRVDGGPWRGHHIVVVAYPETGKTAMAMTLASNFAKQGLKVLYIGNEDLIKSIVLRALTSLLNVAEKLIRKFPDKANESAQEKGYDNMIFAGLTGGSLPDIRALVVKHKPDALIVDQIRNVTTNSENRTLQLEAVARAMRNMAREFDLVAISITQGADSARNKLILDMGDVDGSNVGIPGTADLMIMMGMNQDYEKNDNRMITLAKNKISGKHESWPVCIDRERSRIFDIGESDG